MLNWVNKWILEEAVKTITFNEFRLEDTSVDGYRIITNLGNNEDGHIEFSIEGETSIEKNWVLRTKLMLEKDHRLRVKELVKEKMIFSWFLVQQHFVLVPKMF